jgi:hypothetical protein
VVGADTLFFIGIVGDSLIVEPCSVIFDIDDGFIGGNYLMTNLNDAFKTWKDRNDITIPVFFDHVIEDIEWPKVVTEMYNFLVGKGHACVRIDDGLKWCQKDVCDVASIRLPPRPRNVVVPTTIGTRTQIDDKQYSSIQEQEHDLRKQGHTCIQHLERLPPAIKWCEQTPCVNRRYRQAEVTFSNIVFSGPTISWKAEPTPME